MSQEEIIRLGKYTMPNNEEMFINALNFVERKKEHLNTCIYLQAKETTQDGKDSYNEIISILEKDYKLAYGMFVSMLGVVGQPIEFEYYDYFESINRIMFMGKGGR